MELFECEIEEIVESCEECGFCKVKNEKETVGGLLMGVRIIKRKDGVYDIYDETAGKWIQSYASADNVLDWLSERRLALLGFEDEEAT